MTPEQRKIRQLESELATLRSILYVIMYKVTTKKATSEIMAEAKRTGQKLAKLSDVRFQAEIDDMWIMMTKD